MRILVTGGAGFLGTNLCRRLVERGHEVVVYDIADPLWPVDDVLYRRYDIAREETPFTECQQIYHLACPASPVDYMARPIFTLRAAVVGTINVLAAAARRGARVLIASTSEVYGDPLKTPQDETHFGNVNSFGPRAIYDEGKRAAEAACYASRGRVDFRIARIFNTYGPYMRHDDGRMIPSFITAALRGEPMNVQGGLQTRSLCYVDDLIEGLQRLMACDYFYPVNLGDDREVTVEQVAREVSNACNVDFKFFCNDLPQDDPKRRCPNIARAKTLLDWKPKIDLEEGIARTVAWFQKSARI